MKVIYSDKTGPFIAWDPINRMLIVEDFHNMPKTKWWMPRPNLFIIGIRMVWIALHSGRLQTLTQRWNEWKRK